MSCFLLRLLSPWVRFLLGVWRGRTQAINLSLIHYSILGLLINQICECNIKVQYLLVAAVLCPWLWLKRQQRPGSHVFTITTCSQLTNQKATLLIARENAVTTPTGKVGGHAHARQIKASFSLPFDHSRDRLVVRTLRCGRNNPGSNPGLGIFFFPLPRIYLFSFFSTAYHNHRLQTFVLQSQLPLPCSEDVYVIVT